jgi:hypothetical protein
VQLRNDHSIATVPLFRHHDNNSVRYRWKVPEQKIGNFLLGAKSSANSNNSDRMVNFNGRHTNNFDFPLLSPDTVSLSVVLELVNLLKPEVCKDARGRGTQEK